MSVTIIVGAQWGDEGKGKIVDFLAEKADVVARATGGNNAGHTVVVGDNVFKFNLIPSGIIHKGKLNICGNGMVVYPKQIIKEIQELEKRGFKIDSKALVLSSTAHIITEEHVEEDAKKGGAVGTTGRGIGPCYAAKISRTGLRVGDFVKGNSSEALKLRPLVRDTYSIINNAIAEGKDILIEGAQGTMLDIDHGTYPYVTSSNPTAAGQCTGVGIGPKKVDEVIGIAKAYITRVGRGPFPTEQGTDEQTLKENKVDQLSIEDIKKANKGDEYSVGKVLRKRGLEYGTTTGRARRTGWFDGVVARYATMVNGLTSIVITKLDCLGDFDKIKVCTAYKIEGKVTKDFPLSIEELKKAKPVYEELKGWKTDISKAKSLDELPKEAKAYLVKLSELAQAPVSIVSVGPKRDETIVI